MPKGSGKTPRVFPFAFCPVRGAARAVGEGSMLPISDTTMRAVEYALDGLKQRADTRANNVSNVNTPNFEAKDVDFESALKSALAVGRPEAAPAPAVVQGNGLPDAMGNTVDLEV